ncbi:hypothetical protein DFP73DRAFT_553154 [Morchella snyderi]|nr:hypothetical protein DFP73DRAFT_553154 [Morchella snyderi]
MPRRQRCMPAPVLFSQLRASWACILQTASPLYASSRHLSCSPTFSNTLTTVARPVRKSWSIDIWPFSINRSSDCHCA